MNKSKRRSFKKYRGSRGDGTYKVLVGGKVVTY